MNRALRGVLPVLILTLFSFSAGAQTSPARPVPGAKKAAPPTTMKAPTGSPEFEKVRWMVGDWRCSGRAFASTLGPQHPVESTVKVSWELGNQWLVSRYRETRTAQNPAPLSADEYWTYDPSSRNWERIAFDSTGGWAMGNGNWDEGGKIAWMSEGPIAGQKTKFRDTFTKKSEGRITYVGEIGAANGSWNRAWEIDCHK